MEHPLPLPFNGTIAETLYLGDAQAYQIMIDNDFALVSFFAASNPEWEVGGTVSGTLENVKFMSNGEEEAFGIMSMGKNIFTDLTYTAPVVYVGKDNNNETYAEINGTSNETLNIASNVEVDYVVINRSVTSNAPASMMMPFAITADYLENGTAYTFASVYKDADNVWAVEMVSVKSGEIIPAYKPFILISDENETCLKIDASTTINATTSENNANINNFDREYDKWSMKGTYEYKQWNAGDPELGTIYGVAGQSQGTINAGGAGADETPRILKAKFIDGEVTGIGTLNSETGEFSFGGWYDINGRKIEKPTKSGIYINGNKKVMIK